MSYTDRDQIIKKGNCIILALDPCRNSPCGNNAVCSLNQNICSNSSFVCTCKSGYTGQNCSTRMYHSFLYLYIFKKIRLFGIIFKNKWINKTAICNLNCLNGANCQIINNVAQCVCPCYYSGANCQLCKYAKYC